MVIERKTKYPFVFYFICYLLKYQLIWTLTTIFISYLLYYLKGGDWSLLVYYFSWFKDMTLVCCIGFMPIFAPFVYYYQCFSMIRKISIDEKSKTLRIDYTRFFFWKKSKEYLLGKSAFCCSFLNANNNFVTRLFFPHFNVAIEFDGSTDNEPLSLLLKDRCGWKREQLTEIHEILKKYCSDDDC